MEYRINKEELFNRLIIWDGFLKRKIQLIACGGTAMTLIGVKDSTKDIDFLVPNKIQYEYLIKTLKKIGYDPATGNGWRKKNDIFIFDLFKGKRIHTTELLESPLEQKNHILLKEYNYIYLGILNYYDLIISKLFRYTTVDIDDCLSLIKTKKKDIEIEKLKDKFYMTASYDVSEEKVKKKFEYFLERLKKEGLING